MNVLLFFSFLVPVFFFLGKLGLFGVFYGYKFIYLLLMEYSRFFLSESGKKFYSERSIDVISIVCEQFNKIH